MVLALSGVCFVLHHIKTLWFKSLRASRKKECHLSSPLSLAGIYEYLQRFKRPSNVKSASAACCISEVRRNGSVNRESGHSAGRRFLVRARHSWKRWAFPKGLWRQLLSRLMLHLRSNMGLFFYFLFLQMPKIITIGSRQTV